MCIFLTLNAVENIGIERYCTTTQSMQILKHFVEKNIHNKQEIGLKLLLGFILNSNKTNDIMLITNEIMLNN